MRVALTLTLGPPRPRLPARAGDFPDVERYREILSAFDLSRFPKLDKQMIRQVGEEWGRGGQAEVRKRGCGQCVAGLAGPAAGPLRLAGSSLRPAGRHAAPSTRHLRPGLALLGRQVDDALSLDIPALMRQMENPFVAGKG